MSRAKYMFTVPARQKPQAEPLLVDAEQVAPLLGCTGRHLRNLAAENKVPHVRLGKLVKFNPAVIRQWVEQSSKDSVKASA